MTQVSQFWPAGLNPYSRETCQLSLAYQIKLFSGPKPPLFGLWNYFPTRFQSVSLSSTTSATRSSPHKRAPSDVSSLYTTHWRFKSFRYLWEAQLVRQIISTRWREFCKRSLAKIIDGFNFRKNSNFPKNILQCITKFFALWKCQKSRKKSMFYSIKIQQIWILNTSAGQIVSSFSFETTLCQKSTI